MTLKLRIREIREAKGHTLSYVAGQVGVSIPHLSDVERGKKNINNHLLTRIAAALRVEPRDLLGGSEDPDEMELTLLWGDMGEEDRLRLKEFARALHTSRKGRGPAA